jgi:hypothetical protein
MVNLPGIGLMVVCYTGGTVGMVSSVIMVMECSHQGRKEKNADKIE